jgi:antitoxin component YwqK of YwqJK toxin-antitoxin module
MMLKVRWFVWLACFGALACLLILPFYYRKASPQSLVEIGMNEIAKTNGLIWKAGDVNPFSGFLMDRFPDGKVLSRSEVKNGRLDGVSLGYYTNGVLQVKEHFVAGVSDGVREKWYPDGSLQMRGSIVGGEFHGNFRRWHTNGQLSEVMQMKRGKADGEAFGFFASGYRKSFTRLKTGEVSDQVIWKDGELKGSDPVPKK